MFVNVVILLLSVGVSIQEEPPWKNYTLPIPERVANLLSVLTVEEKFSQITSNGNPIPRLGIKKFKWGNEALHGVVNNVGYTTVFPQPIATGATWDPKLVRKIATAVSDEARGFHNSKIGHEYGLAVWAPNANLFTHARWGRGHETYGESVEHAAQMNVQYILGLQQGEYSEQQKYLKLVSTPKHFLAYQLESAEGHSRFYFDAKVTQRDLTDTYLAVWKRVIVEAKAAGVMCSYNAVNGIPSCANKQYLTGWFRDTLNFTGYVVSDCGAIMGVWKTHKYIPNPEKAAADSLKAGTDCNCGSTYQLLNASSIKRGLLTENDLDVAVGRLFTLRFRLGEFDPDHLVPWKQISPKVVNSPKHRELARQANRESIVLLKNQGNVLPIDTKKVRRIAVIGPNGNDTEVLLGNYHGIPSNITTPFEGIRARGQMDGVEVTFDIGIAEIGDGIWKYPPATANAEAADLVIIVIGLSAKKTPGSCYTNQAGHCSFPAQEKEALDRASLRLPHEQSDMVRFMRRRVPKTPIVVVSVSGGPVALDWELANCEGVVMGWYGGEEMGNGLADVLFGDYGAAGRLPWTMYPYTYVDNIAMADMTMNVGVGRTYRYYTGTPILPFGFGLTYTQWNVTQLQVTPHTAPISTMRRVHVQVQNTGQRMSDFVIAVYVRTSAVSPKFWGNTKLVAFERVYSIKAGDTATVDFTVTSDQLSYVDDEGKVVSTPGDYTVYCENASEVFNIS